MCSFLHRRTTFDVSIYSDDVDLLASARPVATESKMEIQAKFRMELNWVVLSATERI